MHKTYFEIPFLFRQLESNDQPKKEEKELESNETNSFGFLKGDFFT